MNFALVLAVAVFTTGFIWFIDLIWRFLKRRIISVRQEDDSHGPLYWIVEYSRMFFPVLLVVFVLRSFVIEPFRIPSGSMLPTLHIGDFILVNKYQYGIRLPVINKKIFEIDAPDYGDVMVFRFPLDENVNFIKRVVGLPGDKVAYSNKMLTVNGETVAQISSGNYSIPHDSNRKVQTSRLQESFGPGENHQILVDEKRPTRNLIFKVPEDSYFVLGDNRDYSNDSRFWGFVPEENIIGRAFFIWFSWSSESGIGINWSRIANAIE